MLFLQIDIMYVQSQLFLDRPWLFVGGWIKNVFFFLNQIVFI